MTDTSPALNVPVELGAWFIFSSGQGRWKVICDTCQIGGSYPTASAAEQAANQHNVQRHPKETRSTTEQSTSINGKAE